MDLFDYENIPEPMAAFQVQCRTCSEISTFDVNPSDMYRWRNEGEYAQVAFPYLTDDQRELLISQTCGPCFNKMFPEDEDA